MAAYAARAESDRSAIAQPSHSLHLCDNPQSAASFEPSIRAEAAAFKVAKRHKRLQFAQAMDYSAVDHSMAISAADSAE